MKRRLFLACMLSSPALSRAAAPFSPDRDGYGRQKDHDHQDNHDADRVGHGKGHARYFRPEDREMLGRYYPVQSSPPGLKKMLQNRRDSARLAKSNATAAARSGGEIAASALTQPTKAQESPERSMCSECPGS